MHLISQVFSCMNPIVCLAAWTYFLATYLGERYNNIYVYRWVGGRGFVQVVRQCCSVCHCSTGSGVGKLLTTSGVRGQVRTWSRRGSQRYTTTVWRC